jgi:hypothetical protein
MTKRRAAIPGIVLACLLGVVAGMGCSSRQVYPVTWPALTAGQAGCREFAGRYRDAEDSATWESLARLLFAYKFPQRPDSVTLSFLDARRLQIDLLSAAGESSSVVLLSDPSEYRCDDGVLVIKGAGTWTGDAGALGVGAARRLVSLELRMADRYLVVKSKERTVGVANGIPWWHYREEWHRFERLPT